MPNDDMPVTEGFTLKEWLAAISAKLDRLENKLDSKAETTMVVAIEQRLTAVEKTAAESTIVRTQLLIPNLERVTRDVEDLKDVSTRLESVDTYRKWLWGMGAAILANVVISVT